MAMGITCLLYTSFKSFLKLYEEGRKEYVARFGPLSLSDLSTAKSFTWLNDPWPWEYSEEMCIRDRVMSVPTGIVSASTPVMAISTSAALCEPCLLYTSEDFRDAFGLP